MLEFDSDGRKWTLPAEVRLLWDDGTETVVQVDPALSTRSGRVAAGLRIRLVLALPQDAPAAPPIALRLRRDTLPIVPAAR
ncbi:MAG: hypothetical protein FJ265_22725 [Planctomycetes bacterium]|nr:hypothetical protein [Planctomycetota bacterium]